MSPNAITGESESGVALRGGALSIRQRIAAKKLLLGYTVQQAADAARVDKRTVFRWLDDPDFEALLTELESQTWDRIGTRIALLFERAVDVYFAMYNREVAADDPVYLEAKEIILRYGGRQALLELAQSAAADGVRAEGEVIEGRFIPERTG